ncbi:Sulfur carrier protein FdhD [Candidatus Desulfarcum epimagneticum]|uniref:Sulfur carrier protein FdhD n=1 Tax=uncultured Desulfobacteraceae bacterium TaxID=218296 RepID=A0A484HGQ9_9BACT|nr:Sulfur carrier protein FdhD [uncultured Desulfobacteraceae bacterium]
MKSGRQTEFYPVLRCGGEGAREDSLELINEEPLLIRVEGEPYSVVMRTPGEELFHAAGFCLAEGIADSPDDFASVGHCPDLDPNVVEVRVKPLRREKIARVLKRRGFVSQTSCGICGKEMLEDLKQELAPAETGFKTDSARLFDCVEKLYASQTWYPRTRGSHAAALFDRRLDMLSFAEDAGRHNALDKAVGKALMGRKLDRARALALSSRISYEMVQKAARARIPLIVSKSRPTALAADLGRDLGMTLAFSPKRSGLVIVCGRERVTIK